MRRSERWQYVVYVILALAIVLQLWSAFSTSVIVTEARKAAEILRDKKDLDREKTRQELIGKQVENNTKGGLENTLATSFGALAAALVTIAGALLAWRGYWDARTKERQDRLGAALTETLKLLVSTEWRQRVVGAAGLLPFFDSEQSDFHLQALAPLVAAARFENELPEVRQSIRLAIEQAMRAMRRERLVQVSWQGVKLPSIQLGGLDLRGIDFRDAVLENANFTDAKLDAADFSAAHLQGAVFAGASLAEAKLAYADVAGADFSAAKLSKAALDGMKVLNLDLARADFTDIGSGWRGVPWDATKNWRSAQFDPPVRQELDGIYGAAAPAVRVLMLMWEIPPLVAGGTWTACYHLVRNLRRRGADVTVVVPWDDGLVVPQPFGVEVPIVLMGITPPEAGPSDGATVTPYWSPYSRAPSPAAVTPYWSPYSRGPSPGTGDWSAYPPGGVPFWSTYTNRNAGGPYGAGAFAGVYGSSYARGVYAPRDGSISGSILFRLIGEFRRRLETYVRENPANLIHAHDWVTFAAAEGAASLAGVPWIAHFHSTEADRQPERPDPIIQAIERRATQSAARIVVPSRVTRDAVAAAYGVPAQKIEIVPNMLSEGAVPTSEMGRFETKQVTFLGRLSMQKGIDRFRAVAEMLVRERPNLAFQVFGDGELRSLVVGERVYWRGPIGWDERGRAFRGASVVLVPSRFEPFGMVVLEAMQHRVPVIYPTRSGAAEVLESGVKLDPDDLEEIASAIKRLLDNLEEWESTVRAQAREIEGYPRRDYPDRLMAVWNGAAPRAGQARAEAVAARSRP